MKNLEIKKLGVKDKLLPYYPKINTANHWSISEAYFFSLFYSLSLGGHCICVFVCVVCVCVCLFEYMMLGSFNKHNFIFF